MNSRRYEVHVNDRPAGRFVQFLSLIGAGSFPSHRHFTAEFLDFCFDLSVLAGKVKRVSADQAIAFCDEFDRGLATFPEELEADAAEWFEDTRKLCDHGLTNSIIVEWKRFFDILRAEAAGGGVMVLTSVAFPLGGTA